MSYFISSTNCPQQNVLSFGWDIHMCALAFAELTGTSKSIN